MWDKTSGPLLTACQLAGEKRWYVNNSLESQNVWLRAKQDWLFTKGQWKKHPKNWETALWGKVRLYWKKSFIERKALLKERLYWKKGLIETNSKNWSKFQNLVQVLKFGWNSEIWPNIWNFAKNVKFGGNSEIWLKFWNLVEILKFGRNSEIC